MPQKNSFATTARADYAVPSVWENLTMAAWASEAAGNATGCYMELILFRPPLPILFVGLKSSLSLRCRSESLHQRCLINGTVYKSKSEFGREPPNSNMELSSWVHALIYFFISIASGLECHPPELLLYKTTLQQHCCPDQ